MNRRPPPAAERYAASKPLIAELAEHMSRRGLTAEHADAWLFAAPQGGPLRYSLFRSRVWTPAVTKADLGGLTFHCLRHSAATTWVPPVSTSGPHSIVSATRPGGSSWTSTAHVATDADRAAADLMGTRSCSPGDADGAHRAIETRHGLFRPPSRPRLTRTTTCDFTRAGYRNRTDDLLITSQLLCQLS